MLKLAYSNTDQRGDLVRTTGNLDTDEGLETAVTISLFTDARAKEEDAVQAGTDPRGWWGAALMDEDPDAQLGSRLWRAPTLKANATTLVTLQDYVKEALAWMIADGVAASVDTSASFLRAGVALLEVQVLRPGKLARRWRGKWEVQLAV